MENFFQENGHAIATVLLTLSVLCTMVMAMLNRLKGDNGRGIGWSFIRFMVIAISLPIAGVLALNNQLTGEAAAIIAGAMGYAFGKAEKSKDESE